LRGKRLEKNTNRLLDSIPPPAQGNVAIWREESHRLHDLPTQQRQAACCP
jgi:hypothetical protein